MKPNEPSVSIGDVDAAFREAGSFPQSAASAARLDAVLVAYAEAMKQRAVLPEHVIVSLRAALNAVPHLSDARVTAAIKLCLDHYFPG
jgi:hypothetical protein